MKPVNLKIVIRSETDADVSAISEAAVAAFKPLEISHHTERGGMSEGLAQFCSHRFRCWSAATRRKR